MIDRDDREKLVKGNRLTGTTREMEREDGHLCTLCVCVCVFERFSAADMFLSA